MYLVTTLPHMKMIKKLIHITLYLTTNYIKSTMEEDIEMNHYRTKNFPDPINIGDGASKIYVDNKFNDPSVYKKTQHMLTSVNKIMITLDLLK